MMVEMTKNDYLLWLSSFFETGPTSISKIIGRYRTFDELTKVSYEELSGFIPAKMAAVIKGDKPDDAAVKVEKYKEKLEKGGYSYITILDDEYPDRLKYIPDPPQILFYKGDISLLKRERMIAIVGARQATDYGREAAAYFSRELSQAGFCVVSGLAFGIDTAAHKGAIKAGGRTIGVMGSGINDIYPKGNTALYKEMYESQLVISENGLDIPSFAFNFPVRNRIISGLSCGVIIVEAREKSGSLITADQALEQGRSVFAVPGRINDPMSVGTNRLIHSGAVIAAKAEDIIEEILGVSYTSDSLVKKMNGEREKKDRERTECLENLSEAERLVMGKISNDPSFVDDILEETKLGFSELISILIRLEQYGLVRETERGYYILKK